MFLAPGEKIMCTFYLDLSEPLSSVYIQIYRPF